MFGIILLTFASSVRLGGAANTLLEGISIAIFMNWTCEQKLVVNKLQFNKYRCNSEVAITNSHLQDGRSTCWAAVL